MYNRAYVTMEKSAQWSAGGVVFGWHHRQLVHRCEAVSTCETGGLYSMRGGTNGERIINEEDVFTVDSKSTGKERGQCYDQKKVMDDDR